MTTLFIANISSKENDFQFRLPGVNQIRRVIIPAGKQAIVLQDVHDDEIEYVVNQHKLYGLVHNSEAAKACVVTGLIYSTDKPVTSNVMEDVREKNIDLIDESAHEARKIAAVAINGTLAQLIDESRISATQNNVEVEISEIPEEGSVKKKMLREKIKVSKG